MVNEALMANLAKFRADHGFPDTAHPVQSRLDLQGLRLGEPSTKIGERLRLQPAAQGGLIMNRRARFMIDDEPVAAVLLNFKSCHAGGSSMAADARRVTAA